MVTLEGYKSTDIGPIPQDWVFSTWSDVLEGFTSGATPYRANKSFYNGSIKWITSGELNYNTIFDTHEHISIEAQTKTNLTIHPVGTFLMAITGLEAAGTRGSCGIVGSPATTNQSCMAIYGTHKLIVPYLFQYYIKNGDELALKYCQGTKQQSYTAKIVKLLPIVFPNSINEQQAIAIALSDMDKYIASLEKLIGKKKAIKQGAMQELLTGKRRLPGFSGKWVLGEWQDVLDGFTSGATPYRGKQEYYKGNIKWVSSGELNYNTIFDTIEHISEKAKIETSLTVHPAGTFLMAITGLEAAGTRGSCAMLGVSATTNQSCMAIYATEKMDVRFLYHYYILHGDSLAWQYCQGTKQQSYTARIVKKLPIFYPVDIKEQSLIAAILSDMDNEIDTLISKLSKARLVKQGMMQELLTGRIRLVESSEETAVTAIPDVATIKQAPIAAAKGHNKQFDDAVTIAAIVNAFYSDKYPLGRKKVQKLLYLLRRHQDESTAAFKKKAAGPYADEVRYKGGEPVALKSDYIQTQKSGNGTIFTRGKKISQALDYINKWSKQPDIQWLINTFRFTSVDDLELLATVDMAICDLEDAGTPVTVASIKHLIATNKEWKAKLQKKVFSDGKIAEAIKKLKTLL